MYYVIKTEYIGSSQGNLETDYDRIVNGCFYDIRTFPGRAEPSRRSQTEGWLGTIDGWFYYAHGVFSDEREACAYVEYQLEGRYRLLDPATVPLEGLPCDLDPRLVVARYYAGDEIDANIVDAGSWIATDLVYGLDHVEILLPWADAQGARTITATTSDEELTALAQRVEADAAVEGLTLWGTQAALKRLRAEVAEGQKTHSSGEGPPGMSGDPSDCTVSGPADEC